MPGDQQSGGFGGDALAFGMMNSLRTGDARFDMLIVVLVPLVMAVATGLVENARPWLRRLGKSVRRAGRTEYTRIIRRERRISAWGGEQMAKDQHNHILQKAITLYLSQERPSELKGSKNAAILLTAVGKEKSSGRYSWNKSFGNTAEQLEQYLVTMAVPDNTWVEVDDGLEFMRAVRDDEDEKEKEQESGGGGGNAGQKLTIDFTFRSSRADGKQRINSFLKSAFDWYVAKVESQTDRSRYLYMMQVATASGGGGDEGGDDEEGGSSGPTYKRYKLSEEKTFDSLFFPQKKRLLHLLHHFMERTGKFAIPGYPHKLGLLLHGPPGTGKTSLIKALAQHTGRSIVSVPLGRIKTNQELMDCIFDQSFKVPGEDMPIKLDFSKIVFVMEDVDAATSIVLRRDIKDEHDEHDDKNNGDDDDGFEMMDDNVGMLLAMLKSTTDTGPGGGTSGGAGVGLGGGGAGAAFSPYVKEDKSDKLNLSGMLNVLDGVVDCPNRIVVMTSNHPEKLDPALIRPGRVNLKLYLGYIELPEAQEMIALYFGAAPSKAQSIKLKALWASGARNRKYTPAQLEQLCAECESVNDLVEALEEQKQQELRKQISRQLSRTASLGRQASATRRRR